MANDSERSKRAACPFCGGTGPVLYPQRNEYWTADCSQCGAQGPVAKTEALAKAAWNRRADTASIVAEAVAQEQASIDRTLQVLQLGLPVHGVAFQSLQSARNVVLKGSS